jgi:iron complex outermembrane receptor protein
VNVSLTFKPSDRLSATGGIAYKKFNFDATEQRRASETSVPVLPTGTTLGSVTKLVSCCSGLGVPAGTPTTWLIADIDKFNQLFNIYSNSGTFAVTGISNASARGNNRGVQEEDKGVFGQVNFNFDFGIPVRGDFGVRYVKTNQTSYGYVVTTAVQRAEAEHDYSDVLPSLNVVAEITPDLLARLGAAKVMARPSLAQVTPGGTVNTVGNLSVSTGNPLLDPIRAKTVDLSLEWYFGKGSLLSGAVFYKDIDSFIQTLTENKVFNTTGLPLSLLSGTTLTGGEVFAFNAPVNTPGGNLKGFEINYQQQFRNLPGFWSHFGALLNYTYVDSKIDYFTSATSNVTVSNDLLNLSRNAYNATIFYEDNRFTIRASAAYRDKYITKVPASNAFPLQDVEGTNSTLNIDASASFAINDHFSVSLEGLNLTDEFNDQYIDGPSNRVVVYTHTGRLFFLGARYKF